MLYSCGVPIKCQWSRTDKGNCLPSDEYEVTTGRTVLEFDALGLL